MCSVSNLSKAPAITCCTAITKAEVLKPQAYTDTDIPLQSNVTLSRLLGHSSLDITQNYINLLVSDLSTQVDEINLLDKFSTKKRINLQTRK